MFFITIFNSIIKYGHIKLIFMGQNRYLIRLSVDS
jgi:hypothetical protein